MSIKTIGKAVQSNSAGLQKRINKSAEKLVFDVLQSTQYSTPIASTVRELVTNACDSQREEEIALEILSGKKNVETIILQDMKNTETQTFNLAIMTSTGSAVILSLWNITASWYRVL